MSNSLLAWSTSGQELSFLDRPMASFENFMGDVAITLVSCFRKLPCTQWFQLISTNHSWRHPTGRQKSAWEGKRNEVTPVCQPS